MDGKLASKVMRLFTTATSALDSGPMWFWLGVLGGALVFLVLIAWGLIETSDTHRREASGRSQPGLSIRLLLGLELLQFRLQHRHLFLQGIDFDVSLPDEYCQFVNGYLHGGPMRAARLSSH